MTQIRKDVLTFMPLTCTWARELMENVEKTCLSKGPLRGWIPMKMHIVDNPDLEEAFEDRKVALRKMGRTEEELKEEFCFLAESWRSVVSMCKYGVRCSEKKTNILGDTRAGLHLNRNYDMLLRFMTFRNFITARCIVVLRVVPGRAKKVMPRFKGRTLLHPSKHYDSHTSMIQPDPNITICEGLAHNFIYIYQLDEKSKLPLMHPRQAVPYAVIQLRQPYRVTVNRPFLSFRDRFLAQMKHKEAANGNKTYRTYIKMRHLKGTERKRSRSRSRKSDERNRKSEYSDSSQESDNSTKRRTRRNEMPKLKPVRKRSKTPTTQRSSSEKDQPANAETDKSCIKTKLQKIEEEIKLRQSKLTVLRHIKSNHDLEKNESDAVKEELTTTDSYSSALTESTGCDVEFAPKISCVYSTSSIDNIDMVDHAIIRYRELSSGASTPTLDEPGDQGAKQSENVACGNHLDMTDNTDRQNKIACSGTAESQCSTQRENIDNCKITFDANKEKIDDNKESKTHNVEETDNSSQIEKKIVKEELELESSKQDDSNNVEECVEHESEEPIESSSTDKNIDIKTLFREAIYKMDPSDLYELLTEKLAGEEDHSDKGIQQQNTTESNNKLDNEHSGDVVGLDLTCKSKCNGQGNKVDVTEKNANDNKNSCDTDFESKTPEIKESHMFRAVSAVEDHSYSAPKESCIAGLDNLDILASVASELQAAKVVDFKTKTKSKAITSAINILNENKQEQEYIFDAEKFNPNIKGEPVVSLRKLDYSKTHDIKQYVKENEKKASDISSSIKEDSLLRIKMEPLENETDRIETGRSHAKTNQATNKRKNDKKLSGLEKELSSLISSSISPVIASTKRKTANSVAAAFAASEQPHIQTKNINTRTFKHHKIIKQNDTKTKGENEPSTKSPKESNSQHTSNHSKISGNQEPKFICRENLFEKFASSDVIEKSCDRETDDSNELFPPKVQKTTAETQEKTPQEIAKTVIKQEPGVSDVLASKTLSSMSVANVSSDKANCSRKPADHLLKKSLLSPTSDLDESIIDLMNKQVTESMMHTEMTLNALSVNVKKEPVSPKEELSFDENTPVTKIKSGNTNETSDDISTTDDKSKTTEVDLPQSIVNIKKEPCSTDAESFSEINKFTEENQQRNQTIESNVLKQSVNLPITTVESKEITTELDKTLKDLEQVIGLFSDRVQSNSGDAEKDNCSPNKIVEKAVKSSKTDVKTKKFKTVLDRTLHDSSEKV